MKKQHIEYIAANMQVISNRDRIFLKNPVLIQAMGLAPIVVAANTLNNALILAIAVLLMIIPTRVISSVISRVVNIHFRAVVYSAVASVCYIGVSMLLSLMFGIDQIRLLGIYLPILILEPLIIRRYVKIQKEKISVAFIKALMIAAGFIIVLFITAFIRELIGFGTMFGITVFNTRPLPLASMVSGGFIIVGILAATIQVAIRMFKRYINIGVRSNADE